MDTYQKAYDDMVDKGLSGTIKISGLELFLTIDTEFFRSVNPFIVFNIGNQKVETDSVKINSKKKCVYDKVIDFEFQNGEFILVQIFDKHVLRKNKYLG